MIWTCIHIVDILFWLLMAGSVFYVVFFALCSLWPTTKTAPSPSPLPQPSSRFLVIYPAYQEDRVIVHSVSSFLRQDYPQELYQLVVISDHMRQDTNEALAQLPVTLLRPTFEKSSKAKALQYAINNTEGSFTHVVILDADNVVSSSFLSQLNQSCQQGYQAIQCHRTAKNSNNEIAVLDGVSEEINNTIFRRAHNIIGLSSALIGSGMCFDYAWFRSHVGKLSSAVEDRELEALLMRQNIFVKYEEDIHVMDEKVCSQDNFQRQRMRWMTGQVQALLQMLPYLPTAILKLNINYADKTIQQMLIPRSLLLAFLPVLAVVMTLIYPLWSIKWWLLLACFCIALAIAIPPAMRSHVLIGKLAIFPQLVWRLVKNLFKIRSANRDFIHTEHSA